MINTDIKLTVMHDDNASFADYSSEAVDFSRDTFTMELNKDDDYLYIGFEKPISAVYCEMSTANTNAGAFAAEYYKDIDGWTTLPIHDDTKSFTRSGFIQWDRDVTDWDSTEINSITKYYVRLRPSVTHSATIAIGINLVFSDDNDLKEEFYSISDLLPGAETSFILAHVASRNHIIQLFRNKGFIPYDVNTGDNRKLFNPWDLLNIAEIRNSSCYLTLSKIFRASSDDPGGNLVAKAEYYESLADNILNGLLVSWDQNNDGITNTGETLSSVTMKRITR